MASETELISAAIEEIWEVGEQMQLDPFPIHFEIVPAKIMYEIGSYGLPGRFSHWTHGKAFHQMKTMYDYGLSKIYELIINTNPAQAFLMEATHSFRTSWSLPTSSATPTSSRTTPTSCTPRARWRRWPD